MFKRRKQQKTDYVQRLALLKSGRHRLVVRRSLNSIHIQLIAPGDIDKTVLEVSSNALKKYGWKGHCGNMPAAYLTGYLAGLKAVKAGVKEAVADIGLHISVRGSNLYAAIAGAKAAGLDVPAGKEAMPKMERINGQHIAAYAQKLKGSDKYKKQFSGYMKSGLAPEEIHKHFEETKNKIVSEK